MSDVVIELVKLNDMVRCMSVDKRYRALGEIGNLLVQMAGHCRPEHLEVFGNVLGALVVGADSATLAALSRLLAPMTNAPIELSERLALDDDIAVAEPLLMQSCCISDEVLCNIAHAKSQSHQLAIACRSRLSATVTESLLNAGEAVVLRYVANNQGAEFSDAGVRLLAKASARDGALATLISQRGSLQRALNEHDS